jgi:hypothetical protein
MPAIIFTSGAYVAAPSWRDLESKLRGDEWNPENKRMFRIEMARRARVWSETRVDKTVTPREFVQELERAGLLRIIDEEERTWQSVRKN